MNTLLSICIPTYNRAGFLRECLDAFVPLVAPHRIPIYVSDNGSTDGTVAMLEEYQRSTYQLLSFRSQTENRGIDQNMVDVLAMASSRYAWLFGDDDLPTADAISTVLKHLDDDNKLVIVNASTHNADFSQQVEERRVKLYEDRVYPPGDHNRLMVDTGSYITYLGGLIVDLPSWRSIDHKPFLNTDYLHVSVVLRYVIGNRATLCAEPVIKIRLQPPSWARRAFEVEMINWPRTIWSQDPAHYSDRSKRAVVCERPTGAIRRILAMRGYGHYDRRTYDRFVAPDPTVPAWKKVLLRGVANLPREWARAAQIAYLRAWRMVDVSRYELALFRLTQGGSGNAP